MNWVHIISYYGFVIIIGLSIVLVLMHMLYQNRTPTSIVAWLLSIIFLPYIAIPLYFITGSRKRKHLKKSFIVMKSIQQLECKHLSSVDLVLRNNGIPPPTCDNLFTLYTDGVAAYSVFLEQIKNAKRSIYICTYILNYDEVTKPIFKILEQKARNGLDVRLLLDSVGSYKLHFNQRHLKKLRKAGVKVRFFMPIISMPPSSYINLRNHRKIYIFDKETLLSGGMNLSRAYINTKHVPYLMEDLMFMLRGSSVSHYLEIFASDWEYASNCKLDLSIEKTSNKKGDSIVQVVPSGPDFEKDALYEALTEAIYTAKEKIWIVTPYFSPDITLMRALFVAKHRGVDVKLITPFKSDHKIADFARSSYMRELEENGIHVALYEGRKLHAKAILFDDTSVMLGSVNFDNRSLFLNYEAVSLIYSKRVVKEVEDWMILLLKHSRRSMEPASRFIRLFENFMRIFAPLT